MLSTRRNFLTFYLAAFIFVFSSIHSTGAQSVSGCPSGSIGIGTFSSVDTENAVIVKSSCDSITLYDSAPSGSSDTSPYCGTHYDDGSIVSCAATSSDVTSVTTPDKTKWTQCVLADADVTHCGDGFTGLWVEWCCSTA